MDIPWHRILGDKYESISLDTGESKTVNKYPKLNKYMLSVIVCSFGAGVGSEFAQHILSRGKRSFDYLDIVCNVVGSGMGILLACFQEV